MASKRKWASKAQVENAKIITPGKDGVPVHSVQIQKRNLRVLEQGERTSRRKGRPTGVAVDSYGGSVDMQHAVGHSD